MFGGSSKELLNENSKFDQKPYAAFKVFAHEITKIYRDSYNIFGVNGILLIMNLLSEEKLLLLEKYQERWKNISGLQSKLTLGNLDASRDWGYAKDYVKGMWMMLHMILQMIGFSYWKH